MFGRLILLCVVVPETVISFYVLSGSMLKLDEEIPLMLTLWGVQSSCKLIHVSGMYLLRYINNPFRSPISSIQIILGDLRTR